MRFGIIGAGMAGLACANELTAAGHAVVLFDKGRGPGGRMSTRRLRTVLGDVAIDHGAQYFIARDPEFQQLVSVWAAAGLVAPWAPAGGEAWVGVPGMSAVVKDMAARHEVKCNHRVTSLVWTGNEWRLLGGEGEVGPFDAVVVAIPAEQAAVLLALHDLAMARVALLARSQPCWAAMFVFERSLAMRADVIRNAGPIAWAARNSAKPGRSDAETWVVHANPDWSKARLEDKPETVIETLLTALAVAAGVELPRPLLAAAHRWRFALSAGTQDGALWNSRLRLGVCGDWLLGPRVECAWQSGRILARACIGSFDGPSQGGAKTLETA